MTTPGNRRTKTTSLKLGAEAILPTLHAEMLETEPRFSQHGTMRKIKHRGIRRVAGDFLINLIACNLVRIPKLALL